ncbi:hypothetical protein GCM10009547_24470 [Sporichthya brevicatena]|uniref:Uncharacterized protein n=1 Tax=Sporichthya brevicatena TaxID=171442 RepID=A0ABN1GVM3_9ACTN
MRWRDMAGIVPEKTARGTRRAQSWTRFDIPFSSESSGITERGSALTQRNETRLTCGGIDIDTYGYERTEAPPEQGKQALR